jgi:hypothetical protein
MHIYPEFLALQVVLSRLPYFYIIQHITTGAYYAGYKSRKPNSLTFLKPGGYQTSSKIVKDIIIKDSLDSFKIIRICHFETKEEAFKYETRFLKKVGVPYNLRFLNQHVTNNFGTPGKKLSEEHKSKLRGPFSEEHKSKMRGPRGPQKNPTGPRAALSEEHKSKLRGPRRPFSEEHKAKLRAAKLGKKLSEKHKAKIRESKQGNISQELK